MACDTRLKARQTVSERKAEVRRALERLNAGLLKKSIKARIGPQGAIAFEGFTEAERDGVSDACAYRLLMVMGSALARAEIARAEQLAGRAVDRKVVAVGAHSHDGGSTWHDHKG